jgi:hypothetical protein
MNRFRSVHRKTKVTKQDFRDGPFGDDLEVIFARNLLETIRRLRLSIAADEIDEAIRRSVTLAVQALDETFRAIDTRPLINTMTEEILRAGREQSAEYGRRNLIGYRFDVTDERAFQWARNRAGQLISNITDEVRTKVSSATMRVLDGELSMTEARNEIARSVGLHDRWQNAVDKSYETNLDNLIEAGIDPEDAEVMAQQLADNYAQRLIRSRASNIARTEVATAQNQGRYIHWQQLAEGGVINATTAVKEWRTAPEFVSSKTDVCPICEPMDGVRAPLWAEFPDVNVVMPPAHPNCRCRAVLVVQPIEDVIEYVEAQREALGY